jgi:hypothetical protein
MLSDIERKVLRIIANFSAGRRRMPSIHELCVKTGRTEAGIMKVLAKLAEEFYIEWGNDNPEKIVLIEAWERKPSIWRSYS